MDLGQAQNVLLQCLAKTIDPREQKEGEQQLLQLSQQAGFGVVLSALLSNPDINTNYRQLAGVVLRQYVEKHWDEDSEAFIPPLASDEDKVSIRRVLPSLLADANSKVQTAGCMAIAAVGAVDWPARWPELVEILINAITSDNSVAVQGGLKCLALFAEDITDHQLTQTIPLLFPALLRTLGNSSYPERAQRRAIIVYRICSSSLYTVTGGDADSDDEDGESFWKIVQNLLNPTLPQWLTLFKAILDPNVPQQYQGHGLRLEVVKTLTTMCRLFPKMLEPHMHVFLPLVWNLVSMGFESYCSAVIQGNDLEADDEYDEDGDAIGISAFVCEMFEFFTQMAHMPSSVQQHVKRSMPDLIQGSIRYMQMTKEDIVSWEDDPNEFIAFEEDFLQAYSVRVAAHKLLTQYLDSYGEEGAVLHTLQASQKCLEEANGQKNAGNPDYWKLQESAMFALGFVADELAELGGEAKGNDVSSLIQAVIIPELQPRPNQVVYLRARAIWCVSHFAPLFSKEGSQSGFADTVLQASILGLQQTEKLPVRMAATKAIGMLAGILDKAVVANFLPAVLPLVCELLAHATAETLHLCLDTLVLIVSINIEATARIHADLVPLLLETWGKNATDRIVTEGIVEVIESMANIQHCCRGVQERALPTIMKILSSPESHYSGVVEAALDLLTVLVKASANLKSELHPIFIEQAVPLVLKNVLTSDDSSVLESGTTVLTEFVRVDANRIAQASVDNTPMLQVLCQAVSKLLAPELDDQSAYAVGALVTQMIFKLSDNLGQENIGHLIRAVVIRLYSAAFPDLVEGLLLVFARLFHAHGVQILQFLLSFGNLTVQRKVANETAPTPDNPYPRVTFHFVPTEINAMEFVLQKWVVGQQDFHAPYPTKVSLTALLQLLEVCDDTIAMLPVQGYPEVPKTSRRVTRSQAKGKATLTYTKIPLAAKIVSLAAQEWKEQRDGRIQKEKGGASDDDEDDDFGGFGGGNFMDAAEAKYLNLSDMIGMYGDDDDDEDLEEEMYPESKTDPINQIELESHLQQRLRAFAQEHAQKAQSCTTHLSPDDNKALAELLMAS